MSHHLHKLELNLLTFSLTLRHPTFNDECPNLLADASREVFNSVLSCAEPFDGQLGIALAGILGRKEAWNSLLQNVNPTNVRKEYNRLQGFTKLGIDIGTLFSEIQMRQEMDRLRINSHWAQEMKLLGISFDETLFFQRSNQPEKSYQSALLPWVIERSGFDVELALEYGRDFMISDETVLSKWLQLSILSPQLTKKKKKKKKKKVLCVDT
eukprot:Trichotokara_eunicae@DN7721_c0_g1_i1.p1